MLCREAVAEFQIPQELLWTEGLELLTVRKLGSVWRLIEGYCTDILAPDLVRDLNARRYDIALVDLIYNECGLALGKGGNMPADILPANINSKRTEGISCGLLTTVSMEFRRHGIPYVFYTPVSPVFRAKLPKIPRDFAEIRVFHQKFRLPPESKNHFRGHPTLSSINLTLYMHCMRVIRR
jgi:hypothetical protein